MQVRARENIAVYDSTTDMWRVVRKDEPFDDTDPVVAANRWLFAADNNDPPEETTTGRPGERRNVHKP